MRLVLLDVARTGATLLLGLFAGGLVFTMLAPSLRSLPGPAYVRYWQALNTDYGRAMPVLLLTCLTLLVTACVAAYPQGRLVLWLTVAATVLVVATIALTVTGLEPLNRLADSWDADRPAAGWQEARLRWWTLHLVRTAMATLAFVLLLAAQVADRPHPVGAPPPVHAEAT